MTRTRAAAAAVLTATLGAFALCPTAPGGRWLGVRTPPGAGQPTRVGLVVVEVWSWSSVARSTTTWSPAYQQPVALLLAFLWGVLGLVVLLIASQGASQAT